MPQHDRTIPFSPVLVLLALAALPGASAIGQEIVLEPGQSCLSAGCHENLGQKNVVHIPAASGTTCIFCHEAPAPTEHSFTLKAQGGELCAGCHNVVGDNPGQHVPVQMGMCTMCHEVHQSDNRKLLKKRPVAELCLGCHNPAEYEGETVHGVVADGNCTGCHSPHASEHDYLLKATIPGLCFDCHDQHLRDADGTSLPATILAFTNEEINKHEPFGAGQCHTCHEEHASPNHRLLKEPYPADFYTSYAEEKYFCFSCHDASAFREPRTLTATEFRNGNLNLHFRHVNREKGRTCRTCHDHHGARNAKLIRDRVPFGDRFISITDFELTETGGQCGPTCHSLVKYDRFEPEENGLKVSSRQGEDASAKELQRARQEQMN